MEQAISGHVVRLFPAHSCAVLLLDNAQEIVVGRDCMSTGIFERLHIGDRVWYFAAPGEESHTKHSGRVVPILVRYGTNYNTGFARATSG